MTISNFLLHQKNLSPEVSNFSPSFPSFLESFSLLCVNYWKSFYLFFLNDMLALDWPSKEKRFQVLSLFSKISSAPQRFYLERKTSHILLSLSLYFSSASWLEREIFDLFGLFFLFHRDLRRILTDYGFSSFPLRKDHPLAGFLEVVYSSAHKSLFSWEVSMNQHLRSQIIRAVK